MPTSQLSRGETSTCHESIVANSIKEAIEYIRSRAFAGENARHITNGISGPVRPWGYDDAQANSTHANKSVTCNKAVHIHHTLRRAKPPPTTLSTYSNSPKTTRRYLTRVQRWRHTTSIQSLPSLPRGNTPPIARCYATSELHYTQWQLPQVQRLRRPPRELPHRRAAAGPWRPDRSLCCACRHPQEYCACGQNQVSKDISNGQKMWWTMKEWERSHRKVSINLSRER